MSLSDFEDSDLTELTSEEEEPKIAPKSSRNSTSKKPQYKVTNALRPPRTVQYTTKFLYEQIVENSIQLDPEYQRDVVWPEHKMSHLIDSLFSNYYIPPVIFAVSPLNDGYETRTCIDGKQRLTSIQRFMDGLIPHRDSITGKKLWYKKISGGSKRTLLPKNLLQVFASKQIVCVEYEGINNDQEREIFQRVQLGVALTPAERLQATVGEMATFVREVQALVLGPSGFNGRIEWDHTRGRDFQCIAAILFLTDKYPTAHYPEPRAISRWLVDTPVRPAFRTKVNALFDTFFVLVRSDKLCEPFLRPTRVSPIEFVMSGVLIAVYRDRLSFVQLSSAISKLRADVRSFEKDIRINQRTTKRMIGFILKVGNLALGSDGKGDLPASKVVTKPKASNTSRVVKKGRPKRKRVAYSDEDESSSDSDEALAKKKKTTKKIKNAAASAIPPKIAKVLATSSSDVKKPSPVKKAKPAANAVASSSKSKVPEAETNKGTIATTKSASRVSKPPIPSPQVLASGSAAASTTAANQKVSSTNPGSSFSRRATHDLKPHPISALPTLSQTPVTGKREVQTKSPITFTPKADGPLPDTTTSQDPRRRSRSHGMGHDSQENLQLNRDHIVNGGMGTDMNMVVDGVIMLQQPPLKHIPNGVPLTEAQIQSLLARLPSSLDTSMPQSPQLPSLPSSGTANNFPIGISSPIAHDGNQNQSGNENWAKSVLPPANGIQIPVSVLPTSTGEMGAQIQNAQLSPTLNLLTPPTTVMEQGPMALSVASTSTLPVNSTSIPTLSSMPVKLEPGLEMAITSKMGSLISNNNHQLEQLTLRASTSLPTSPIAGSQPQPAPLGDLQRQQDEPMLRSSSSRSPNIPPWQFPSTSRESTALRRTSTSSASSPPPVSAGTNASFKDDQTAPRCSYGPIRHDDASFRKDRDQERESWERGRDRSWDGERDRSWDRERDRDWTRDRGRDWRDDRRRDKDGNWHPRRRKPWEYRY